ncbi:hypothetical protein ABID97_002528 [Variovorax sp. OAS795]|uniref:hypothetical protein n=1 Tax=Variovorax sp. OAS795 TaxID=3034231 RepID=UPI00339B610B
MAIQELLYAAFGRLAAEVLNGRTGGGFTAAGLDAGFCSAVEGLHAGREMPEAAAVF